MAVPRLIDILVFHGWSGVVAQRMHRAHLKKYGPKPVPIIVDAPGYDLRDAPPEAYIVMWIITLIKEGRLGRDVILTQESMRKLAAESPNGPTQLDPFGLLRDYVRASRPDAKHGGGVCLVTSWIDGTPAAIVFECWGKRPGIRVVVLRAFRYLMFKWIGLLPPESQRNSPAVG